MATNASRRRFMVYPLLTAGWLLLLLSLSFMPPRVKLALHTKGALHNGAHIVAFATLTYLMDRSLRRGRSVAVAASVVAAGVFALGWGVEWAEHLVWPAPIEWSDVAADAVGAVLGLLCWALAEQVGRMRARPATLDELMRGADAEG